VTGSMGFEGGDNLTSSTAEIVEGTLTFSVSASVLVPGIAGAVVAVVGVVLTFVLVILLVLLKRHRMTEKRRKAALSEAVG